jgi:hypothetical protein
VSRSGGIQSVGDISKLRKEALVFSFFENLV